MMKFDFRTLLASAAILMGATSAYAQDEYIVVGAPSDVYEESELANPVINQWANPDRVLPGMAFKVMQQMEGSYSVEFPGWTGAWVPSKACATPAPVNPEAGTYTFPIEDNGTYTATLSEPREDGTWRVETRKGPATARRVSPTLILIYDDSTGVQEGTITAVGGKTYLYIYDTMLLGWD